jgi:hypothetical protein
MGISTKSTFHGCEGCTYVASTKGDRCHGMATAFEVFKVPARPYSHTGIFIPLIATAHQPGTLSRDLGQPEYPFLKTPGLTGGIESIVAVPAGRIGKSDM